MTNLADQYISIYISQILLLLLLLLLLWWCVRMCKSNGDKRWTKQNKYFKIHVTNTHKMGVFRYEWNFFQQGDRKHLSRTVHFRL